MKINIFRFFIVLFSFLFIHTICLAGEKIPPKGTKENPLIVCVAVFPPMVMKNQKGEFHGYDIELWTEIAKETDLKFVFREVKFQNIFSELEEGRADVALSGITITDEREKRVDFSHHYFNSGLRIMVRESKDTNIFSAFQQIWSNKQNQKIVLFFILFLIVSGFLFLCLERKNGQTEIGILPGMLDGVYWSTVTSATVGYGDKFPKSKAGKILAMVVIFIGIAFFNYFQAQLSSMFVMQKLESSISSKRNLAGKLVATATGTTSVETLKMVGANIEEFDDIESVYKQLDRQHVDAVVLDAPSLMYYIKNEGAGKAMLVGELFDRQYYGIALRQKSELRETINCALLKLRENGVIAKINHHWLEDENN